LPPENKYSIKKALTRASCPGVLPDQAESGANIEKKIAAVESNPVRHLINEKNNNLLKR
jgi:hypothetical protein